MPSLWSRRGTLVALVLLGCTARAPVDLRAPAPVAERSPPPGPDAPAPPPVKLSCGAAPADTSPDPETGMPAVWRAEIGGGTGGLALDLAGGLAVVRHQGGRTVSLDVETGGRCATLVDAPSSSSTLASPASIDPYSLRARPIHGALVGPSGTRVVATDLVTGKLRWTREVARRSADTFALRDGLRAVEAGSLDALAFRAGAAQPGGGWRVDELLVGVDPASGVERWRTSLTAPSATARAAPRVVTDDGLVIVTTSGRLAAYEAETGHVAWSVSFPPVAPTAGPLVFDEDGSASRFRPRVVAGGGFTALALPGVLRVYATKTGAPVGEVDMPGSYATDLVAGDGLFYAAVETGTSATMVAVEAESARVRWRRDATYGIWQMRAVRGGVGVAEGDGRLWLRDAGDGSPRLGLTLGGFAFAILAREGGGARILVPTASAVAAFDVPAGARPKSLEPFARWDIVPAGPPRGECHPSALSWIDGEERVAWRRALPPRLRASSFGACDDAEVTFYRRAPRANGHLMRNVGILGVLDAGSALVEADETGALVLDKKNGDVLLDLPASKTREDKLFFDSGSFALDGASSCTGECGGGRVFASCGDGVLYFDGDTAVLLAPNPWRVEARGKVGPAQATSHARASEVTASVRLGSRTLTLRGFIEMR